MEEDLWVTTFETVVLLAQPKTLKFMASKTFVMYFIQTNDCIEEKLEQLKLIIQHNLAQHLRGKWLSQYVQSFGPSLFVIEDKMDKLDPSQLNSLQFLNRFFTQLKSRQELYNGATLMADSYISEKCNNLSSLPTKLFHLGIRKNLKVLKYGKLKFQAEYLSSNCPDFVPFYDPLIPHPDLAKFENTIYAINQATFEGPIVTDWTTDTEIPRRLTWATFLVSRDRFPEGLVQVLSCFKVLDLEIHSRFDCLELFSLLIFIFANLSVNIRCQVYTLLSALSYVVFPFEIFQLLPSMIAMFRELGHFKWVEFLYHKFKNPNVHSQYYEKVLTEYAETLIDCCENHLINITAIREFHKYCKTKICNIKSAQGASRRLIHDNLTKLNLVIGRMEPSSTTDLFRAQFYLIKGFLYKIDGSSQKNINCCINQAVGLCNLIRENLPQQNLIRLRASVLKAILMKKDAQICRELINEKLGRINKTTLSSLKCKLYFKSLFILLFHYDEQTETRSSRSWINSYVDDLITNYKLLSNYRHYRLRLLKMLDKVFFNMFNHRINNVLCFSPRKLQLSEKRDKLISNNLFPHFTDLNQASSNQLYSNYRWFPNQKALTYLCRVNDFIVLDPYIKNHISFGYSQLKYRDG